MIVGERDSHTPARTLALEVGHLDHRLDDRLSPRLVFRQFEPHGERVLARRVGNLIDERFGCEFVVARADTAPGVNAHAAGFAHVLGPHIADAVERLIEAARADVVLATRRLEAWGRRDRIDVLGY